MMDAWTGMPDDRVGTGDAPRPLTTGRRRHPAAAVLLSWAAAAFLSLAAPAGAAGLETDAYRLGVGDALSVTVFGRTDLTGQFTIGPDAVIRLPLVGEIEAAGRMRADIEADLSEKLNELLDHEIHLSVNVAAYRPIYVMGDVTTAGEYPFSPGLSALQAFVKAGGAPALLQLPYNQAADAIEAEEELRLAEIDIATQLVRRSTLDASLAGTPEIALPPEIEAIRHQPAIADMIDREAELLSADRTSLQRDIELLHKQHAQYTEEIDSLTGQQEALVQQTDLIRAELRKIQGLADRGLAPSPRLLELKSSLAELDGQRYEVLAFLSRARQQLVEVDMRIRSVEDDWQRRRLQERAGIEALIEKARIEANAARMRMSALAGGTPYTSFFGRTEPRFWITRKEEGSTRTLMATPDQPMHPGDVLRVVMEPPSPAVSEVAGPPGAQ
jgi:polysaccharide biosynthesis/export protein